MEGRSPTHNRNERSGGNNTRKSNPNGNERTNNDEDVDPIGYQAIVLDPNPKAVCQLLGRFIKLRYFRPNFNIFVQNLIQIHMSIFIFQLLPWNMLIPS